MIVSKRNSIAVAVSEQSQVGEARRVAAGISLELQLSETLAGKVGIVVSELASNLMKHTQGGELIFRSLGNSHQRGIEILSIDKGCGYDLEKCLRDGYSSAGTSGTGLGSVQRLSSYFEVHSVIGVGTVSLAQLWEKGAPAVDILEMGVVNLPLKGEKLCGDAWSVVESSGRQRILVVDGLGHGEHAAAAADTAVRVFQEYPTLVLPELVQSIHLAMRHTRGGAVVIAEIDRPAHVVRYVGIGNIAGMILHERSRKSLVSQNGTVGAEINRVTEFQYPWLADSSLLLISDGIGTRWSLDDYPGLQSRHPSIIAGILYRDFHRERDDATIVVARTREAG